ncbi:MAG: UDP-3-O-(3-hydroxymyristoyl)glucosamine N-acyltransferase [Pseudomonadota bacterium]
MPDPRFFPAPEPIALAALAATFDLQLHNDTGHAVSGVAPLDIATGQDLSFVASHAHLEAALASAAAAFVVPQGLVDALPGQALLVSVAPQRDYARIARQLYPASVAAFDRAVDPTARLGEGVRLAQGAVIGPGVEIGVGSTIGSNAVIGAGVVLGEACAIGANVSLSHAILGARVRVMPGACLGQDGFGYAEGEAGLEPIPQLGRVMIGDDVDIGSNTTIDRGAGGDTVIGPGTKIDNQVQIGHNCKIGAHCVIVSQAGISGSVTIGNFVQIGGKVGIADHIAIGDGAKVAAGSGVIKDIGPGETHGGYPAVPVRSWHRQSVALARLAGPKRKT